MTALTFDHWLKFLSIIGAIGSFVWGVWVWQDKADKEHGDKPSARRWCRTGPETEEHSNHSRDETPAEPFQKN